jgi:hypothetical protein
MCTTIYGLNFVSCFCNLLARIYKPKTLCSQVSAFQWNPLSYCKHANKYCFLKNLGVPFPCLNVLQHFWRLLSGIWRWYFHLIVAGTLCPWLIGKAVPPGTSGPVDPMEGLASSGMLESKSQLHKGTWRRLGNQLGVPPVRLVKNPDSNNRSAFGRRGAWSPLKDPWVTLSGVKLGISGLGSRAKVCETPPGFSH